MSEKKCIRSHVLGDRVFLLPIVPPYDKRTKYHPKKYQVAAPVRDEQGRKVVKVVEREYPITPETVKSYAESADYHTDPASAAAAAAANPRKSLGDIRDIQKVASMDSAQFLELARRMNAAAEEIQKKAAAAAEAQKNAAAAAVKVGGDNNG